MTKIQEKAQPTAFFLPPGIVVQSSLWSCFWRGVLKALCRKFSGNAHQETLWLVYAEIIVRNYRGNLDHSSILTTIYALLSKTSTV